MGKLVDLTGKKYNKLTVISRAKNNKKNQAMWNCICDCGNKKVVMGYYLTSGTTKSCGCQRAESAHKYHFEDLSGKRFGRLVVVSRSENRKKSTMWECKCDCGNIKVIGADSLKNGATKSCGCLLYESKNFTHGLTNSRLYNIWSKMKDRCFRENDSAYKWYGGRGITICQEWIDDFMNFYNWSMENGYKENLTIDRINVNGNYEPDNCRWVTMKTQQNNRRDTKFLTYNGETKSVTEWCEITGMKRNTLLNRIRIGYTAEECFEVPLCSRRGRKKN